MTGRTFVLVLVLGLYGVDPLLAVFCPECGLDRGDEYGFCPLDGVDLKRIRKSLIGTGSKKLKVLPSPTPKISEDAPAPMVTDEVIPVRPEEVPGDLMVVNLVRGDLMNSRIRVSAFTDGTLERLSGEEVLGRLKKLAPDGKKMMVYEYKNILIEKYRGRSSGKISLVKPEAELPRGLAKEFKGNVPIEEGYDILTTEGIRFGMTSNEVRLLFKVRLQGKHEKGREMVYDKEKIRRGYLTVSYKDPKLFKLDYRVAFIFDEADILMAVQFGWLKRK